MRWSLASVSGIYSIQTMKRRGLENNASGSEGVTEEPALPRGQMTRRADASSPISYQPWKTFLKLPRLIHRYKYRLSQVRHLRSQIANKLHESVLGLSKRGCGTYPFRDRGERWENGAPGHNESLGGNKSRATWSA